MPGDWCRDGGGGVFLALLSVKAEAVLEVWFCCVVAGVRCALVVRCPFHLVKVLRRLVGLFSYAVATQEFPMQRRAVFVLVPGTQNLVILASLALVPE